VLAASRPCASRAQEPGEFLVSPDEPAVQELRRQDALGHLPPGIDLGRRTYAAPEVDSLLHRAAASANDSSAVAAFHAEHPGVHATTSGVVAAQLGLSYEGGGESRYPGYYDADERWVEPSSKPAYRSAGLQGGLWARLGSRTDLAVRARADGEPRLDALYASHRRGGWSAWVGRREVGIGSRSYSSLVQSRLRLDGLGVRRTRAGPLPWILRRLGPAAGEGYLARAGPSGPHRGLLLWGARVSLHPAERVTIGLNRATLFGGSGNDPITPANVLLMLAGFTDYLGKSTTFENTVASVDVTLRARLGDVPFVATGEWGSDDFGLAFVHVPALVGRIELPRLPEAPGLGASLSQIWIAHSCCGYPPWYRHLTLSDGWTLRGEVVGHALGGQGSETRLELGGYALPGGTRVAASVARRVRGEENLFASAWRGVGWAADLGASWRTPGGAFVEGRLAGERGGPGWRWGFARVGLRFVR
jgi:hypothetical protein